MNETDLVIFIIMIIIKWRWVSHLVFAYQWFTHKHVIKIKGQRLCRSTVACAHRSPTLTFLLVIRCFAYVYTLFKSVNWIEASESRYRQPAGPSVGGLNMVVVVFTCGHNAWYVYVFKLTTSSYLNIRFALSCFELKFRNQYYWFAEPTTFKMPTDFSVQFDRRILMYGRLRYSRIRSIHTSPCALHINWIKFVQGHCWPALNVT